MLDNNLFYQLNTTDKTATLVKCSNKKETGRKEVPPYVEYNSEKYTITAVGDTCFKDCKQLTEIIFRSPCKIEKLGSRCFYGCDALTKVSFPSTAPFTKLPEYCFCHCKVLTDIKLPKKITSIGNDAFDYCSKLTSIIIPESVTTIGSDAFYGCSSLTSITIPESVTTIEGCAFEFCSRLTSITIPEGVTTIASSTFSYCSKLSSITIPESVTTIKSDAFHGCSSLTSITIPESVTTIGSDAFYGCSSLTSITIPESVTTIGSDAFKYCDGLTSISIPPKVTKLNNNTFNGCHNLTNINLPEGLTSIDNDCFKYCTSLKELIIPSTLEEAGYGNFEERDKVTFLGSEVPYCSMETTPCETLKIYVPAKALDDYRDDEYFAQYAELSHLYAIGSGEETKKPISDASSTISKGTYGKNDLSYTRTGASVKAGNYATFCMPYDINLAETSCFSEVLTPNGTSLYNSNSKMLLLMLDKVDMNSTIKAGQPFLAKLSGEPIELTNSYATYISEDYANKNLETSLKIYNFDGTSGILTQNTDLDVRFGGTYTAMPSVDSNIYRAFLSNGQFGPTSSIAPFRAYIYKANAAAQAKIQTISWGVGDETTGISIIQTEDNKTESKAPIYSIDGRKISEKGDFDSLPKGVYIQNGRKILVK